jgi:two-component system sensor histidine kinase AlgZ
VPALLLQPVVENAVKHGIAACEAGGRIVIRARRSAQGLRLEVETELREAPALAVSGHGLGLDLTRSRLELAAAGPSALEVTRDERRHVVALTLPFPPAVA